jgi:signal transduction histidine kinase
VTTGLRTLPTRTARRLGGALAARSWPWLLLPITAAYGEVSDDLSPGTACPTESAVINFLTPLLLLARRRFPIATFLVCLPDVYLGGVARFPALVALYTVAAVRPRRTAAVACGLLYVLVWELEPGSGTGGVIPGSLWADTDLSDVLTVGATAAAPIALGLLTRSRRELKARLRELADSRRREDSLLAQQTLSTERARLAREMHDTVAHHVSLISVRTGAVQAASTDPWARQEAGQVRVLAARTLDELRETVGVLRAQGGGVDARARQPRLAHIPRLIADSGLDVETRVEVDLGGPTADRWPDTVQHAAYRTVQEALTNARKHAPGAPIKVRVYQDGRNLHASIRNGPPDGSTPPPRFPSGGHGLAGLHERAHLAGGTLRTARTDDGGYLVHATYPSRPVADADADADADA